MISFLQADKRSKAIKKSNWIILCFIAFFLSLETLAGVFLKKRLSNKIVLILLRIISG
jgi:hypothetical protein